MKRLIRSSTRKFPRALVSIVALFLIVALVPTVTSAGAAVWTDKDDYPPGDTVVISGSGFPMNTGLVVQIFRPHGTDMLVTRTDAQGSFTLLYVLTPERAMVGIYTVIVMNPPSTQVLAITTFTDDQPLSLDNVSSSDSSGTTKTSFITSDNVYARIETNDGSGSMTVRLYIVSSSPENNAPLTDVSGGYDTVILSGDATQLVWIAPSTSGTYYAVVDTYQNGQYGIFDNGKDVKSIAFTIAAPGSVSITVSSSPAGSGYVVVDGVPITTPQTFSWSTSTTHSLQALSPVGTSGTRYVWSSWSDSGTQTHTYTVPGSSATVTANYQIQYELTMATNFGSVSPVSGWYNEGSVVVISATAPIPGAGEQYVWNGWVGTGTISYTGSVGSPSVTMNGPVSETASWIHQFMLIIQTNGLSSASYPTNVNLGGAPAGSAYDSSAFTKWFDENAWTETIGVDDPVSGASGVQYVFAKWNEDSSIVNPRVSVQMTGPVTYTAVYNTQLTAGMKVVPVSINTDSQGKWVMLKVTFPSSVTITDFNYDTFTETISLKVNGTLYTIPISAFVLTLEHDAGIDIVPVDPLGPVSFDSISNELHIKYSRSTYNVVLQSFEVIKGDTYKVSINASSDPSGLIVKGSIDNQRVSNTGV